MTRVSDVDVQAAVQKFIGKDTSNQGIIESIATAFLLNPQLVLSYIIKAKNKLQALVLKQQELLLDTISALEYVTITDYQVEDKTGGITSAQIFLVELDRIGKLNVQALESYKSSIDGFLKKSLSRTKSGSKDKFALTATEAKEDIYVGFVGFTYYIGQIQELIESIGSSVDNFKSVDLSKIVTRRVVDRVRTSLTDTQNNLDEMSKVSIVLEVLAGKSALTSLATVKDLYDPTINTGVVPVNTNMIATSDNASAIVSSNPLPITTSQSAFSLGVNGGTLNVFNYPRTAAINSAFVIGAFSFTTVTIPANSKLYIRITPHGGTLPPQNVANVPARTIVIPITAGVRTFEQIRSQINSGLTTLDTGAGITTYGQCTHFAKDATNILLIYGINSATDKIEVLGDIPGTYVGIVYTAADPSPHELLGLSTFQTSTPINQIDAAPLKRFIDLNYTGITTRIDDVRLEIKSNAVDPTSRLAFGAGIATAIGFPSVVNGVPLFLKVSDSGVPVILDNLDVHPGYRLDMLGVSYSIKTVDNDLLGVEPNIPQVTNVPITIYSDLNVASKKIVSGIKPQKSVFKSDVFNFEHAVIPLLSAVPTAAQVGDCKKVLNDILSRINTLVDILNGIVLSASLAESEQIAKEIILLLETRGMNKFVDLLNSCKFNELFTSTLDSASTGTALMAATEEIGRSGLVAP